MKRTPFKPLHRCANPKCKHPLNGHQGFGGCGSCACLGYVKSLRAHSAMRAKSLGIRRSKGRTNYKARLWTLFSLYIRQKYADETGMVTCVTCGEVKPLKGIHAGHYHPRTDGLALYFDERNVHPQCVACNVWRRGNLTRYAIFLQGKYGAEILSELDAKRRTFTKISEPEYLDLIAHYQAKVKVR